MKAARHPALPTARPRQGTRRWVLIAALAALAVSACSRPQAELPIPQDELPGVLIDVYVAEAEAELVGSSLVEARREALLKHEYDTSDFNETMRLLTEDPEVAKAIYQVVLDSVIVEQRSIRAEALEE